MGRTKANTAVIARATLLALAIFATAAFADPPEGELTAAPGSIAYGMIENADAVGVFDIVHNGRVSVRHPASGLTCHFLDDGEMARLMLFERLPRGEDVGCDQQIGEERITLYATRYPGGTTLQEQIEIADHAIQYRFGETLAFDYADPANDAIAVPARTVRYIVDQDGARAYTRASVAIIGDWTFKIRYSIPAPDDEAARHAEHAATAAFAGMLQDVVAPGNL